MDPTVLAMAIKKVGVDLRVLEGWRLVGCFRFLDAVVWYSYVWTEL